MNVFRKYSIFIQVAEEIPFKLFFYLIAPNSRNGWPGRSLDGRLQGIGEQSGVLTDF
jgi:hypothetical protein